MLGRAAPILFFSLLLPVSLTAGRKPGYVGSETCGECHDEIYEKQSRSNMARTWQSPDSGVFAKDYSNQIVERGFRHRVFNRDGRLFYEIAGPDEEKIRLPVEALTGGGRIGIGFLLRIEEIQGEKLVRPALIEARFMQGSDGRLGLSPGHGLFNPTSIQSALGRVLNADFETRCLTCHGSPDHQPTGEAGVRCENCHGPGQGHLAALENGSDDPAIVNPARLRPRQVLEICGDCHAGFSEARSPRPQDLLISDQVRTLQLSECFVQSDGGFSCISCHDPHENARREDSRYNRTCLSCHAVEKNAAAPCPVNPQSDCVACHMPSVPDENLRLVDHWIRVHPETSPHSVEPERRQPSRIPPRRLFLRELIVADRAEAERLRNELTEGASFAELAKRRSKAPSAQAGGYLGEIWVAKMNPAWVATAQNLRHGEISPVLPSGDDFALLQRMPRDFRFQAIELEEEAAGLIRQGRLDAALERLQKAVETDPGFVRAINALAVTHARKGETRRAVDLLKRSLELTPHEPSSALLLAAAYAMTGLKQERIDWLRRAVELDPRQLGGRLQLGTALFAENRWKEAAEQFEASIWINPLSAPAYFNLAKTHEQLGMPQQAERLLRVAKALEPRLR